MNMFRFWPLFQKHTSLSPLSSAPFPTYPLNGSSKFYVYSFWAPPLPGPRLQVMGASQLPHLLSRLQLCLLPSSLPAGGRLTHGSRSLDHWQSNLLSKPMDFRGFETSANQKSDHFLHHPPSLQACPVKSFSARPPISCGGWANISKIKCDWYKRVANWTLFFLARSIKL